jgi:ArsR family transcriptional regulator, arsenate/arsenite/antimonite-responsive transcriptional repressor
MRSDPPPTLCCPPLLEAPLDEHDAVELAGVLKALADPIRLRLVSMIAAAPAGEVCACDLATPLGRSQPTVSHHLSQLVAAGILDREQRGRWAWFRVRPEGLDAVRSALAPSIRSTVVESMSTE